MRPRLLVAVLLLGCTAMAAPVPFARTKKKGSAALDALQGVWEVKSRTRANGGAMSVLTSQRFVQIEGTTWTFLRADRSPGTRYEIKLETAKRPATLDLFYTTKAGKLLKGKGATGLYLTGVVEVTGNTLKVCYVTRSGQRPESVTPINPSEYLFTMERVKP